MRLTFILAVVVCTGVAVVAPLLDEELDHLASSPATAHADSLDPVMPSLVYAHGYVEGMTREIELRFEGAGQLQQIDVQEGDRVRRGDRLAQLDTKTLEHQVSQAEAQLSLAVAERERLVNGARPETVAVAEAEVAVAQARFEQAERRLERARPLAATDALSDDDFDRIRADFARTQAELQLARQKAIEVAAGARDDELQMAEAKVAMARAQWELAEEMLQKASLRAPCDGVILKVLADPGEMITWETENIPPVLTLADDRQFRVRAFVEELDAIRIATGMAAKVTADGLPDQPFTGRVVQCAPSMTPKRHFSNRPNERVDVKVREIIVELEGDCDELVIGLPVDVYLTPLALEPPVEST